MRDVRVITGCGLTLTTWSDKASASTSSVGSESVLSNSFSTRKEQVLRGYIQTSIMIGSTFLRYETITPGRKANSLSVVCCCMHMLAQNLPDLEI